MVKKLLIALFPVVLLVAVGVVWAPQLTAVMLGGGLVVGVIIVVVYVAVRRRQLYGTINTMRPPTTFDHNLIVIGAGSGGLVSSYIAAIAKASVLLIERDAMGGDCLNTGCVPSKSLIATTRLLADLKRGPDFGLPVITPPLDFAAIMDSVHEVIARIEPHDSVARYEGLGVNVIQGEATLKSPWSVVVDGKEITARAIVLATGAAPLVPPIPGLDQIDYYTSDSIWSLREQPERLVVIGGGPIGCELAQCFARLGTEVVLIEGGSQLLSQEDADVAAPVLAALQADGVEVWLNAKAEAFEGDQVRLSNGESVRFTHLLLALGRRARFEGMGFAEVGIERTERGTIKVDSSLRTSVPSIFACGDAISPYQFTHTASHEAWYATVNALAENLWCFQADYSVVPWITYTQPEVGRVGLSEREAEQQGIAYEVTTFGLDKNDRALSERHGHGFIKVLTPPGKDDILGAAVVGAHSSEILAEFILAKRWGKGLAAIMNAIHPYPNWSEAAKATAGAWRQANKPERLLSWFGKYWRSRR